MNLKCRIRQLPARLYEAEPRVGLRLPFAALMATSYLSQVVVGQTSLTWEQARAQFLANNPTLAANSVMIDEAKASEVTAYLRPNPDFSLAADGVQISRNFGVWRPLSGVVEADDRSRSANRGM